MRTLRFQGPVARKVLQVRVSLRTLRFQVPVARKVLQVRVSLRRVKPKYHDGLVASRNADRPHTLTLSTSSHVWRSWTTTPRGRSSPMPTCSPWWNLTPTTSPPGTRRRTVNMRREYARSVKNEAWGIGNKFSMVISGRLITDRWPNRALTRAKSASGAGTALRTSLTERSSPDTADQSIAAGTTSSPATTAVRRRQTGRSCTSIAAAIAAETSVVVATRNFTTLRS